MSTALSAPLIAIVSAICLCAQPADTGVVQLPLVDPTIVKPTPAVEPLTPAEKGRLALRNVFGPRAVANRMLSVGWDSLRDHPEEWGGGWEGFGKRFGSRMGRLAARNAVRTSTDIAFGIEPRYDRCSCTGFKARAGHALKRVLVSRSDSGGEMPAYSNFTGAYVTPWITYTWYPDRLDTTSRKLQSGTMYLGWRGATNMLREFWPDIKRGFRRGGNPDK